MERTGSFAACAERLSAAFALDGGEPARQDFERVHSALLTILVPRFLSLGASELCEIADESIARLLKESRRQGRPLESPAGWLRTTAGRLALDRVKAPRDEALDERQHAVPDEFAARLLERLSSDDRVKRGVHAAIEQSDDTAVRVVGDYLDLADEMAGSPSTRAVAERCGYSHTTVRNALKRFRRYIQ